jgi:hypothetical protein
MGLYDLKHGKALEEKPEEIPTNLSLFWIFSQVGI